MVTVKFFSAGGPASGVELSGLLDGTYDHVGLYNAEVGGLVSIGDSQDVSWIVDDSNVAIGGGLSESGQMTNNQWVDSTGVSIASGTRVDLSSVVSSGSGTLRIQITDTGNISIDNAKLFAYDGTDVNNDPSGVWVLSYEIVPTALSGLGDTTWALMDATNYNYLVDRTTVVGYAAAAEFNYFVGLAARPKLSQPSGAQNFGLYLQFNYF